jgi:hypothetical protein
MYFIVRYDNLNSVVHGSNIIVSVVRVEHGRFICL